MAFFENKVELEQRLDENDRKLSSFFTQIEENNELEQNLQHVKNYYRISFARATAKSNADSIVESYEKFVEILAKTRDGSHTAHQAIEFINETNADREIGIIFHNIAKVCEIIFWALTIFTCLLAIATIDCAFLVAQPIIGIALTAGTTLLALTTANELVDCFGEFKSLDRLQDEDKRERNLVSFFKAAEPIMPLEPEATPEVSPV